MILTDKQKEIIEQLCDKFEKQNIVFDTKISIQDFMRGYWLTSEEIKLRNLKKNRKEKLNKLYGNNNL